MKILMIIIGSVWGLIGVGNIIEGFGNMETGDLETWGPANLIINFLFFIFPSLILIYLGSRKT